MTPLLLDWSDSPLLPRGGYFPPRSGSITGGIVHNTGGDEDITADNDYHRFSADWDPQEPGVQHAPHIAYGFWLPYDPVAFLTRHKVAFTGTPSSVVVQCNKLWERTWHAMLANDSCVGVALQVDGEKRAMSEAQMGGLRWLFEHFLPTQGVTVPWSRVWGHGECPKAWGGGPSWNNNTICPGHYVLPQVRNLRS